MKKIAVLLAEGFEEIEALTVVDVLRRAGFKCDMVSIGINLEVKSAHSVVVKADLLMTDLSLYDMIVLPGGSLGAENLANNNMVISFIKEFFREEKFVAAICASPAVVLGKIPEVRGKKITSYPGMEEYLRESYYLEDNVVQDNNLITSRGPATTLEFAYKLVDVLGGDSKSLKDGMLYNK